MPEGIGYPEDEAGMPPMEGETSPEAVMEADAAAAEATQGAVSANAPMPEKPFSTKAIGTLVGQLNDTKDAFAGEGVLPDVEWAAPEGGAKWDQPIPPEIFAPLVAIMDAAAQVGAGEFAEKYSLDPMSIVDDTTLRAATVELRRMETDTKLTNAMLAPPEGAPLPVEEEEEGPMPPSPEEMTEEDQALMENMG